MCRLFNAKLLLGTGHYIDPQVRRGCVDVSKPYRMLVDLMILV
jgi:thiazole synthase ThiGH ThiG subunit